MGKLTNEQIVYIVAEYLNSDSVKREVTKDENGNDVVKLIRWDELPVGELSNFMYYLYENYAIDYGYFFLDLENFEKWLELHKGVNVCDEIMDIVYNQPDRFFNEIFPKALEFVDLITSDMNVNVNLDELYLQKKAQLILLNPMRYFSVDYGVCRDYLKVSEVTSNYLNQLVIVKGVISALGDKFARSMLSKWVCRDCSEEHNMPVRKCVVCGSKDLEEEAIVVWDVLPATLTNAPEDSINVPVEIKCEFKGKLVNMLYSHKNTLGAKVKVTGILRMVKKKKKNEAKYFLEVMGIEFLDDMETSFDVELSESAFKEFAKKHDVYEVFKKRIAPTIYGYDEVKEALVLQLFGGVKKEHLDERGNIHILIVGDFAVGKTKLLESFMKLAPNARYVSCISATGKGLTAVVSREEGMGMVVKLGPVVLSHNGFALLDELDKIDKDDIQQLNEIMERQQFTISKGGINTKFVVETSILAAANPKYGRFDDYSSIIEVIDIEPNIISRFDLIFAVKDDLNQDENYVKHKSEVYFNGNKGSDDIDLEFLRAYVWYARNHVFPKLTKEAMDKVNEIYLRLRKMFYKTGTFHFDKRRRESLIRLAEASARVRLSNVATEEDVERAFKIMKYFLRTVAFDPDGGVTDLDVLIGKPKSKRDKLMVADKVFDMLVDENGLVDRDAMIDKLREMLNISEADAEELIEYKIKRAEWFIPKVGKLKRV